MHPGGSEVKCKWMFGGVGDQVSKLGNWPETVCQDKARGRRGVGGRGSLDRSLLTGAAGRKKRGG